MKKTALPCCALCQLSDVGNKTTLEELRFFLSKLTLEKESNTDYGISYGDGQTSVFVIVSPGEDILMSNLKSLGFKLAWTFERRRSYPKGMLKMMVKNV